ncbi:hypothetical protein [Naasia sp. SYSU D00057]|uniref:hypothetical protein n=1 Tax=Naasia sp. SYSU D00057 TaxID=2817380 RepID=UPI001B30961A|nr:hypothetical protein [Naasia sp. SYSU D00057]
MNPFLPRPVRACAAAAIAGVVVLLSACASSPSVAEPEPAQTAAPAEAPAEGGGPDADEPDAADPDEEIPAGSAGFWLASLASSHDHLRTTLGEWDAKGCTVAAAIDGEYLCTGALTSAAMSAATVEELFASVGDQGLTGDELQALEPVQEAAAAAGAASAAWTEAECNWEATPECTPAAKESLAASTALLAALDAWGA